MRHVQVRRPAWHTLPGVSVQGFALCNCGVTLTTLLQLREHWQSGHFDAVVEQSNDPAMMTQPETKAPNTPRFLEVLQVGCQSCGAAAGEYCARTRRMGGAHCVDRYTLCDELKEWPAEELTLP